MKPDNTPPNDRPVGAGSDIERAQIARGQRSTGGGTYGDFRGSPSYKPPSEGGVGQRDDADPLAGDAYTGGLRDVRNGPGLPGRGDEVMGGVDPAEGDDDSVAGEEDPGAADDVAPADPAPAPPNANPAPKGL